MASGVAILPFITILLRNMVKARENRSTTDSGIVVLRISEGHIYIALIVVLLCAQPLVNIAANDVSYTTNSCASDGSERNSSQEKLGDTGTTFDAAASNSFFNGKEVKIPIWWLFTNNMFRGITAQAIDGIPCNMDVIGAMVSAEKMQIDNAALRTETLTFAQQCWVRASNKFYANPERYDNLGLSADEVSEDTSWPGSHVFQRNSDLYPAFQSTKPIAALPYEYRRDNSRQSQSFAEGGYPMCHQWWPDLRARLFVEAEAQAESRSMWESFLNVMAADGVAISGYSDEDIAAKQLFDNGSIGAKAQAIQSADFSSNPGGSGALAEGAQNALATLGLDFLSGVHYTKMRLMRDAMPMLQALVMLVVVMALPIILVFSEYSVKSVIAVTFVQFGIVFWSFFFALAYWLDNTLADAVFTRIGNPSGALLMDNGVAIQRSLMQYLSATFYGALPMLFTFVMGWAGVSVGDKAASIAGDQAEKGASGGAAGASAIQGKITGGLGKGGKG